MAETTKKQVNLNLKTFMTSCFMFRNNNKTRKGMLTYD